MGTIQGLNQLGGKGGSAGKSPMNGGKPTQTPAGSKPAAGGTAPLTNEEKGYINDTADAQVRADHAGEMSPGLGQKMGADGGDAASTPDISSGLGEIGSKDKLNMIAKLYGGGMGLA